MESNLQEILGEVSNDVLEINLESFGHDRIIFELERKAKDGRTWWECKDTDDDSRWKRTVKLHCAMDMDQAILTATGQALSYVNESGLSIHKGIPLYGSFFNEKNVSTTIELIHKMLKGSNNDFESVIDQDGVIQWAMNTPQEYRAKRKNIWTEQLIGKHHEPVKTGFLLAESSNSFIN